MKITVSTKKHWYLKSYISCGFQERVIVLLTSPPQYSFWRTCCSTSNYSYFVIGVSGIDYLDYLSVRDQYLLKTYRILNFKLISALSSNEINNEIIRRYDLQFIKQFRLFSFQFGK